MTYYITYSTIKPKKISALNIFVFGLSLLFFSNIVKLKPKNDIIQKQIFKILSQNISLFYKQKLYFNFIKSIFFFYFFYGFNSTLSNPFSIVKIKKGKRM